MFVLHLLKWLITKQVFWLEGVSLTMYYHVIIDMWAYGEFGLSKNKYLIFSTYYKLSALEGLSFTLVQCFLTFLALVPLRIL